MLSPNCELRTVHDPAEAEEHQDFLKHHQAGVENHGYFPFSASFPAKQTEIQKNYITKSLSEVFTWNENDRTRYDF